MKKLENLKKDLTERVNFADYDEKYIDVLSIKQTIKNIWLSEKLKFSQKSFVEWFCGLPTCLDYPCSEYDCETLLKKYGFTEKEIKSLQGNYNLEKIAHLIYMVII